MTDIVFTWYRLEMMKYIKERILNPIFYIESSDVAPYLSEEEKKVVDYIKSGHIDSVEIKIKLRAGIKPNVLLIKYDTKNDLKGNAVISFED